MFLKIYDASEPPGNLYAMVGGRTGIDYMYQVEQFVIDTTNDEGDVDGPPVRWDLIEGTSDEPGRLLRQWARQEYGTVKEVPMTTGPYAFTL